MNNLSDRAQAGTTAGSQVEANANALALVARQPIYDAGLAVVAYELLYRRAASAANADVIDGRAATLQVITNAVLEVGLDRLAGGLPIHVNYPRELLVDGPPLPLRPERVVIEVLENVSGDDEVFRGIAALQERGHRIALDDYSLKHGDRRLLDVADIVKIDISEHTDEELQTLLGLLKGRRLQRVAEHVETLEQFERCCSLGFEFFQGYFLQRPQTFLARRVPSSKLTTLRLVATLQNEDYSVAEVEQLIQQDVAMSYRVLRCINSSYYNFPRKIESIRQAIVMLGLEQLRQLCALVALQAFDDRPPSLVVNAMIRGRMCERLGRLAGARDGGPYFIAGMFSMLDVLTGIPMPELIAELPLADSVAKALEHEAGDIGQALHCARAYERGTWERVQFRGLNPELIRAAYLDAVSWAESARSLVTAS